MTTASTLVKRKEKNHTCDKHSYRQEAEQKKNSIYLGACFSSTRASK